MTSRDGELPERVMITHKVIGHCYKVNVECSPEKLKTFAQMTQQFHTNLRYIGLENGHSSRDLFAVQR